MYTYQTEKYNLVELSTDFLINVFNSTQMYWTANSLYKPVKRPT